MYLVESPEDVLKLEVKNDARLSFMTQTTLSSTIRLTLLTPCARVSRKSSARAKTTFANATTNRQEAVRALAETG
ncbi:hypothetical protein LNP17_04830 [Klebsiella variicola subsp. variicola]|nr:hypothetical protein [Klebsiella variicola subsp. variicola]